MRIAKKVLSFALALTLVFGCLSVGVSALDTELETTFQELIDNAIASGEKLDFNGTGLKSIKVTDAVEINGDLTIDFGGATVRGPYGCPVFTIAGGNVIIKNARFEARVGPYSRSDLSKEFIIDMTAPALRVTGGNVELEEVICNGASMRVPTTTSYYLSVGSGLELRNGATLVADSCVFTGRYGINNSITYATRGGPITFIDGIAAGFIEGIKRSSDVIVPDNSINYPAGDLIAGLQRGGVTVSPDELALLKTLTDGNLFIVAEKADFNVSQVCEDGVVTVTVNPDEANVVENGLVSYKWIPEAVTVDGKTANVVDNGGVYTATINDVESGNYQIDVKQRMFVDVADFNDFLLALPDYVMNIVNAVPGKIDDYIGEVDNAYENVKDIFYNLFDKIAKIDRNLWRGDSGLAPGYDAIMNALVTIGGKAMVVDHFGYGLIDSQGYEVNVPDVGILSRFEAVYADFKANMSTTEDICIFLVNNYEEIISIVDDLLVEVNAFYNVITTEPWAETLETPIITDAIPEIEEYMGLVNQYAPVLQTVNDGMAQFKQFLQSTSGQTITDALSENDVIMLFNKLDNIEKYYKPTIIDETWLKFAACTVSGEIDVADTVIKTAIISAGASGPGTVSLENGFSNVTSDSQILQVGVKKTLSATPCQGAKFAYWRNDETNKVVSYDSEFEITVGTSTHYTAVFAINEVFKVTFLTPYNGTICTNEFDARDADYQDFIDSATAPDLTGYTFSEWESIGTPDPNNEVYMAKYTIDSVEYNVDIVNEGVDFKGEGNFNLYDTATVSAPAEGFCSWVNTETGEVVSYFRTYSFIVTDSVELEAVYSENVSAGVALNITKAVTNAATDTISFYSERSIKGYSLVENGIIVTNNATTALSDEAFVIEGTDVLKAMSSSTASAGTFIANKRNAGAGVEWFARAYAVVMNADGEIITVYSAVKSAQI